MIAESCPKSLGLVITVGVRIVPDDEEMELLFKSLDASDGNLDGKIDFEAFSQITMPDSGNEPANTVRPRSGEVNGYPLLPNQLFEKMSKENEAKYILYVLLSTSLTPSTSRQVLTFGDALQLPVFQC